jgi:hypothetical protein
MSAPSAGTSIIEGVYTPDQGAADPDFVRVALYEEGTYSQAPGTFNLATAPDDNYQTCNHCVLAVVDPNATAPKVYYQQSGTMTLTQVTSPPTEQMAGSLLNVKLIEVTIDSTTFLSTPVPNGGCLLIQSANFNTVATPTSCQQAEQCGDTTVNVCDPKTATCKPSNCDANTACATATDFCGAQVANATVGACYSACTPLGTNTCGATGQCVTYDFSMTQGVCYRLGTGAANAACNPASAATDISTGCVANYVCMTEGGTDICRQNCNFWSANPTCTGTGTRCAIGGTCYGVAGDAAAINVACTSPGGTECGLQGNAWRGMCADMTFDGGSGVCRKYCRIGGTDCAGLTGLTCQAVFTATDAGLCLP